MEDRPAGKENSITKEFRAILATSSEDNKSSSPYSTGKSDNSKNVRDNNILGSAINDIGQDSLIKGLIYSEILGQPKCKRRGW